jgi:hypothetical protein
MLTRVFPPVICFINDGSVSVPFPHTRTAEITDSLTEKFKMRFNYFCRHAKNIPTFENPFSADVSDPISHGSSNQLASITFYASLTASRFSELCKSARNLASVLGSTYICEQPLSYMKQKI